MNGVDRDDRVVIIDDVISTGGTMVGLIKAIQKAGAQIIDIVCVAEKVEYGGVARVKEETGYTIKSMKITKGKCSNCSEPIPGHWN